LTRRRLQRATWSAHDAVAADYHRIVGGAAEVQPFELDAVERFLEQYDRRGGLIVDVGCGTGRLLPHHGTGGRA
jgi:SAM-dependent methyltransferase